MNLIERLAGLIVEALLREFPAARGPRARAQAHAADAGPGRHALGRADAEPVDDARLPLARLEPRRPARHSASPPCGGCTRSRRSAFVEASPLYESEPWETEPGRTASEQRWYLNCVVAIETSLPPRALLDALQAHRDRARAALARPGTPEARRFARAHPGHRHPLLRRPGDQRARRPPRAAPAPGAERAFVLRPLADIAPELSTRRSTARCASCWTSSPTSTSVRPGAYPARWFED